MKTRYKVVDNKFNQANYPDLIGQILDSPPAYAHVELIKEKVPMDKIWRSQTKMFGLEGDTMLEDFVVKCLRAGYDKKEIVEGLTKYYRQAEEPATDIFNRVVIRMKGLKAPEATSNGWYKKSQWEDSTPDFRNVDVRRLEGIFEEHKRVSEDALKEMTQWREKGELGIDLDQAIDRLTYQMKRLGIE